MNPATEDSPTFEGERTHLFVRSAYNSPVSSDLTPTPSTLWSRLGDIGRALRVIWTASGHWTFGWFGLLVLRGALPPALVYLTKVLIDRAAATVGAGLSWTSAEPILIPALLMGGVLLLTEIIKSVQSWVQTAQAELLQDHVATLVHEKAGAVDLAFYESPMYYDLMVQANGQAPQRILSLLKGMGNLIQNTVTLFGVAALLLPYGVWLPLLLFISTLPAFWVVVRYRTQYHDWWEEATERRRWTSYFDYVLTHPRPAAEVRLLGLANRFRTAYRTVRTALRTERLSILQRQSLATLGAGISSLLVVAGAMVWMLTRVLEGSGTLGDLALFYQAFNRGQDLMRSLLSDVGALYGDTLFLEHLFSFLALESTVVDPDAPVALPDAPAHTVTFDDVSFRYPDTDVWALRHFSLTIPAGKTVALIGPNGAGKSTIMKLLCRFYDPQEGRILLDGIDLRSLRIATLRRRITALFQRPVRYVATAADNIQYGAAHTDPDSSRVQEAARAGDAHTIITDLPDDYETLLSKQFENGTELSGGQWQRITLARAFYREAPLVILDEPTSFMDSWAEMTWLDTFQELVDDRTALVITHRFTTARRADIIHIMRDGAIVESGSHDALMAEGGIYAASWHAQTKARTDDAPARPDVSTFSSANGHR